MANRYNLFYFEAEFKKYLIAGNAGDSTVKNYLSDLHYFFSWLQSVQSVAELDLSELQQVFSHSIVRAYHSSLTTNGTSPNTLLRRLATLRKFFTFCMEQRWLTSNPASDFNKRNKLDERDDILTSYKNELLTKNYSNIDLERHINVIRDLIIHS